MARARSQTSHAVAPGAVQDLRGTIGVDVQLIDRRPLGTESPSLWDCGDPLDI